MNSEYKEMMKRLSLESSKHPRYGALTAGPKAIDYFPQSHYDIPLALPTTALDKFLGTSQDEY